MTWRAGGERGARATPERVGAEGGLIVAGGDAGRLVAHDHVLQGGLLDDIEADAHAGGPLHVVDAVGLQDGVDGQVLEVQLHTHCRRAKRQACIFPGDPPP